MESSSLEASFLKKNKKKKKREREIGELGLTRDVKSLNERGSSHHG